MQACIIISNSQDCIKKTVESWLEPCSRVVLFLNNSTDYTEIIIKKLIKKYGSRVVLHKGRFVNFSQVRNDLLRLSKNRNYPYSICLDDSYMFKSNGLDINDEFRQMTLNSCYNVVIKRGDLQYESKRIVYKNRCSYVGDVHEILDAPVYYTIRSFYIEDLVYPSHIKRTMKRKITDLEMLKDKTDTRSLFFKANTLYALHIDKKVNRLDVIDAYKEYINCEKLDKEQVGLSLTYLGHLHDDINDKIKFYIQSSIVFKEKMGENYLYCYLISDCSKFIEIAKRHFKRPKNCILSIDESLYGYDGSIYNLYICYLHSLVVRDIKSLKE